MDYHFIMSVAVNKTNPVSTAKRGRRPSKGKAGSSEVQAPGTRERILDAAEQLFGERNFDTVSLREISVISSVNLGLFYYHFGSKEALFEQVVARRANILSQQRQNNLANVIASGQPTLEAIVDAFMQPVFEMMATQGSSGKSYISVLTTISYSDRWLPLFDRYFDETARLFLAELRKILPHQSEETVLRGFAFARNLMLKTAVPTGRFKSLGEVQHDIRDAKAYEQLLAFVCAGIRAL